MQKELKVTTIADWESVITFVLEQVEATEQATVIALSGDLGAGKTILVQLLAKTLGVTEVVTSPTFTIMKGYELPPGQNFERLIHMDAYRIDDLAELTPLRFSEFLAMPKTLFCIEWAEKIEPALPADVIKIHINHTQGDERQVLISTIK
jgi:tRNA threonylcarbamoyladenosine biosynthesis protein TsaE